MSTVRLHTVELGSPEPAPVRPSAPTAAGEGFGAALAGALGKVDGLQQAADVEAAKVAQGQGNLHETALALEKADVSMRVLMRVRNKLVEAYNEVMRMSV